MNMKKTIPYRPGLRLPILGTPIFIFAAVFLKDWPILAYLSILFAVLLIGLLLIRLLAPGFISIDESGLTIPRTLYHFRPILIPTKAIFYWEQMGSAEPFLAIHFEIEGGQQIHSIFRSSVPLEKYQWLLDKLNEIVAANGHTPAPDVPEQDLI